MFKRSRRAGFFVVQQVFQLDEGFRQREKPYQDGNHRQPVVEVQLAEGEARIGRHRVEADRGDKQPQHPRHEAFEWVVTGDARDDGQSEDREGKIFRPRKAQRKLRKRRGHRDQHHGADHAADEGSAGGNGEGAPRFPLVGHLISVEHGGRGGRRAGGFQQDRRDGAAVDGSNVNADQNRHGRVGAHPEGKRQKHGHAHGGAEAWQGPDDDAAHDAHGQKGEYGERKYLCDAAR